MKRIFPLNLVFVLTISLSLVFFSCEKKVGLLPKPVPPPPVGYCDTISYAEDLAPIITASCTTPCHAANGIPLNSYDLFKKKAEEGKIQNRVVDGDDQVLAEQWL